MSVCFIGMMIIIDKDLTTADQLTLYVKVIDAISNAISSSKGCYLLDVDPGMSTNRTVYTFVGSPNDVVQGALAAARVAHRLIDMSVQKGEHPRIG